MNLGQRVIVSVALGAALAVAAATISRLLIDSSSLGGWFAYEENTKVYGLSGAASDSDVLRAAAVWLIAIAVWLMISYRLFRPRSSRSE